MDTKDSAKMYVDYLEKENTILSVIASFCVGAAAFVLLNVLFIKSEATLIIGIQKNSWMYIVVGCALLIYSANRYLLQRARLAWYQGQICQAVAKNDSAEVIDLIEQTDTLYAWRYYNSAYLIIFTAFVEYGIAFFAVQFNIEQLISNSMAFSLGLLVLPVYAINWKNFEAKVLEPKFPKSDDPAKDFFKSIFNKSKKN